MNPGHALRSLVPQSRDQRVYLVAALINIYGTGLIITAMTPATEPVVEQAIVTD